MTRHRLPRGGAAFVAPALAVLVATAPAHAESYSHRDARHDVVVTYPGQARAAAIDRAAADVTSIRTSYAGDTVVLSATLRSLVGSDFGATWVVRTGGPKAFYVEYVLGPRGGRTVSLHRGSTRRACPALRSRVFPHTHTIALRVPRTCLDSPGYVRTGLFTSHAEPAQGRSLDDAQRDRGVGPRLTLGPEVRRD